MKSFLATVTIAGFAAVMLFGAFLMVHGATHAGCLPSLMVKTDCQSLNPVEYVRLHLGALESLTNMIPAFGMLAAFSLIVFLFSARISSLRGPLLAPQRYNFHTKKSDNHAIRRKFLKWFAIHEKRDPSPAFAAST